VRTALRETGTEQIAARRSRVANHSWRSKAEDVLSILDEVSAL
jgi:hypothetical protein